MGDTVSNELASNAWTTEADGACPECEGVLWDGDNETVCGNCSIVMGTTERTSRDSWSYFFEYRHETSGESDNNYDEYPDSGILKCVGGYLHPYDWQSSEEADGSVVDLSPENFYK